MRVMNNQFYSTKGAVLVEFTPEVMLDRRVRWFALRSILFLFLLCSLIGTVGVALAYQGGYLSDDQAMIRALASAAQDSRPEDVVSYLNDVEIPTAQFYAVVNRYGQVISQHPIQQGPWKVWRNEQEARQAVPQATWVPRYATRVYVEPIDKQGRFYLVLGMTDTRVYAAGAILVVVLVSLMIVVLINRIQARSSFGQWRQALKDLHQAMTSIIAGNDPKPLNVGSTDEMSYLMAAFNAMSWRLIERRRELTEANEHLEQRVAERTAELQSAMEELDQMASHDALTGLANRRELFAKLEKWCDGDNAHPIGCVMFDLDGFKTVNDTLGHKMGDEMLTLVAQCLNDHCTGDDFAARLGGDEFVLMLRPSDVERAVEVADSIRVAFEQRAKAILETVGSDQQPSTSSGVSERKAYDQSAPEPMLLQADEALYAAKRAGKRQTVVFDSPSDDDQPLPMSA